MTPKPPSFWAKLDIRTRRGQRKQELQILKRDVVLRSSHLQIYIKSLALTIMSSSIPHSFLPWIPLAVQIGMNIEHLHLRVVEGRFDATPVPQVEKILASPSLRSVTLDLSLDESYWSFSEEISLPAWILWSISDNINKLEIHAPRLWAEQSLSNQSLEQSKTEIQRPPRYLTEISFKLATWRKDNRIVDWARRLEEPSFNFSLSRTKNITITTHDNDDSLWGLADKASKTLEELTIPRLPSE